MICIHHNDLDGKCAAAIVNRRYINELHHSRLAFIEMDYAKKIDFSNFFKNELVVIVDFSLKPEVMNELLEITKDVIWIDHHVTAKDYPYQHLDGLRDFEDKHMAGCELTWNYFYPEENMPEAVKLIGDYDKWALQYKPACFEFYEGLKIRDCSPVSEIWRDLLNNSNVSHREILTSGAACIIYRDNYCAGLCKSYGYETEIDGHKAYACNQFMFGSGGFGERFDKYPICLAYIHNGKNFTVSLYSTTVDVSVIAKAHGGGGHKGAAGFVCEKLPF
jgi:oligoribonuclease NrnB/cAMP/cGMP phosphodiesterase (DHH superfamily)